LHRLAGSLKRWALKLLVLFEGKSSSLNAN
jgi:hypothetical protein